jgi:hypothetical protein|tara:strand:- start:957 stop:1202 length:246 start_codon:yes stop_codon:yes gene_type:complete
MPTYEYYNKKTKQYFTEMLSISERKNPCKDPNVSLVINVPKMITLSPMNTPEDKLRTQIATKAHEGLKVKGKHDIRKNKWV